LVILIFIMSEPELQRIVVTCDEQYLPSIQQVAISLQNAGMQVEQILEISGIITGSAPTTLLSTLRSVSGVLAVEPDEPMQAL
jgi:hypothetical protein